MGFFKKYTEELEGYAYCIWHFLNFSILRAKVKSLNESNFDSIQDSYTTKFRFVQAGRCTI